MEKNLNKAFQESVKSIASELTEGFRFISDIDKAVAIFGSGRFTKDNPHYQQARRLARLLAKEKFAVFTGGGPGIMEAANWGAMEGGGDSVGLNILIPKGQDYNKYVKKGIRFDYFFIRKIIFAAACRVYVFLPGGFGTLDEFFEIVNIIHNRKIKNPPLVIAIGKDYWQPLFHWLETNVCRKHRAIEYNNLKIFLLVDSVDETVKIVKKYAS